MGVWRETIEMELTRGDIDYIVELHNQLRHRVASGQEYRGSPGPQPAATYMPDLVSLNLLPLFFRQTYHD